MHRLAIFASGTGTNARQIIQHFRHQSLINISLVVCNKPGAGVLTIAAEEDIDTLLIEKDKFFGGNAYVDELKTNGISFIVLAGFLWKIPDLLVRAYHGNIVNIHPALLPKFGGKGMFGMHVHKAALEAGESESGITIHYVDELYDHGKIIFQATCAIDATDTPQTLAVKVHRLEHDHYPKVIETLLCNKML